MEYVRLFTQKIGSRHNCKRKRCNSLQKINSFRSLNLKAENRIFFSKDEFFSTLKGKVVDDEEYANSKTLYTLLKMRDLSDLNDLYNAQGVILLLEITENRFQGMYEKSVYIPRKCYSASTLSGCIQQEQSKIILTLPTNSSIMEVFEKNSNGWF